MAYMTKSATQKRVPCHGAQIYDRTGRHEAYCPRTESIRCIGGLRLPYPNSVHRIDQLGDQSRAAFKRYQRAMSAYIEALKTVIVARSAGALEGEGPRTFVQQQRGPVGIAQIDPGPQPKVNGC